MSPLIHGAMDIPDVDDTSGAQRTAALLADDHAACAPTVQMQAAQAGLAAAIFPRTVRRHDPGNPRIAEATC